NNPHIVPDITTTTQTLFSSQNNQVDICVVKPIRIIPGPVGIVQMAMLRKLVDTREGREESVMYIHKSILEKLLRMWVRMTILRVRHGLALLAMSMLMEGSSRVVLEMLRNVSRMGNLRKLLQLSSLVLRMRWAISQ
ncbi:hypothetical protein Tco_0192692, partial [Tanacetum coccineum]